MNNTNVVPAIVDNTSNGADQKLPNKTKLIYIDGKPMIYDFNTRKVFNVDSHVIAQVEEKEQETKMGNGVVEESQSEEVFSSYKCHSVPSSYNCLNHPGNIVEASSLSAQNLPTASYKLSDSIPKDIISKGRLSDLQMEGILFACQRHQVILPDGKRAGFFIGDGTGVGKGRQIAGIILDNLCRDRRKHIWFSVSSDLKEDAKRDLNDIGCYANVIDGCQELDKKTKAFGLASDFQEGVLFSTYSTLVSMHSSKNSKKSRLDQLVKWCGEGFDGCIIFDECHKAKNFIPGKEGKSTKVALSVTMIQRLLPKARVIYCSATGVTDLKDMAFMERLGLWGPGTTFLTFEIFLDSLSKRGLGALEMLSLEMKGTGMYVSRGLSYKEAEFETFEAALTKQQIKLYDQAVNLWKELKRSLEVAIRKVGNPYPRLWTFFWSSHQRFFKQLCMSMKVPEILRLSREALENGYSVVIGLQTTGEASMDSELDQNNGELKTFVSLTTEILRRFIYQYFPTEKILPGEEPIVDKWCVDAKCLLLGYLEKIKLPPSPIDELIDELGGLRCVAEMTGRKGVIGRFKKEDRLKFIPRGNLTTGVESVNNSEKELFMSGEKLVAIISDASSTGISLHADERVANQKRRIHITAELPWSADKAVQQLGRSHRSNQTSGPVYKLVTSNLGGEKRFAAAVAKRLQSLGALTKGDRRAATGANLAEFNFDTPYGHQALKQMYDAIIQNNISPGVSFDLLKTRNELGDEYTLEKFNSTLKECLSDMAILELGVAGTSVAEGDLRNVKKFLNRILGLVVERQNLMFDYFSACLDANTKAAKREGRYSDGVTDIKGNSIIMNSEPEEVFKEFQLGMSVTKHNLVLVDRGIPFEDAMSRFDKNKSDYNGFFRSKRDHYGKKLFLLAIRKGQSDHLYTVVRPNTGVSPFEEAKNDLFLKYDKITPSEAENGWTKEYERTKEKCMHGQNCKFSADCQIGTRITKLHLLTGSILSLLPTLEFVVAKLAHTYQLTKENQNLRVVRVELDTGKRLVGLRYPHILFKEVECYLKEKKLINSLGQLFELKIEDETPINSKAVSKAMTMPATIKTFFNSSVIENRKEENDVASSAKNNTTSDNSKKKLPKNNISLAQGKKRKQSNIFDLIVTQSEKKKRRSCPVCGKELNEMDDTAINTHVDNCLIE